MTEQGEQKENKKTNTSNSTIESVQKLLEENSELYHVLTLFKNIKYEWKSNLDEEKPKEPREFLQTTSYNGKAKRLGKEIKGPHAPNLEPQLPTISDKGLQKGTMIEPDEVDAFYIELYYWKNEKGASQPRSLISVITGFTGFEQQKGEKLLGFLKRLSSEKNAEITDEETDEKRTIEFKLPLKGIEEHSLVGKIAALKKEDGGLNPLEIIADIQLPFEIVENYLQS